MVIVIGPRRSELGERGSHLDQGFGDTGILGELSFRDKPFA
jgi:hypothetical protein